MRYLKEKDVVEIAPSTLIWGDSKATFSGEFRPVRHHGVASAWNFTLKADPAVLSIEEFGLTPMKIDEWQVAGSITPQDGRVTISRFVIRAGTASIELAGSVVDTPGAEEVRVAGVISPMSVDVLKRLWPKFLAGKARAWVLERVAGGEVMGGKFTVNLGPADIAKLGAGGELPAETVNVELNLSGMSIVYVSGLPPVLTKEAKLTVSGMTFAVDIPEGKIVVPSGGEIALSGGRFFIPDLSLDPQQGEITYTAAGATPTVLELLDHEPLGYLRTVGMKPDFLGGTAQGSFTLNLPLLSNLEFNQIKLKGAARLNDASRLEPRRQCRRVRRHARCERHRAGRRSQRRDQHQGRPGRAFLAAHLLHPRRPPATDQGDGAPRRRDAREAWHQGQPSAARADADHGGDRQARRGRTVTHARAGRPHRCAAPVQRLGLDQACRPQPRRSCWMSCPSRTARPTSPI